MLNYHSRWYLQVIQASSLLGDDCKLIVTRCTAAHRPSADGSNCATATARKDASVVQNPSHRDSYHGVLWGSMLPVLSGRKVRNEPIREFEVCSHERIAKRDWRSRIKCSIYGTIRRNVNYWEHGVLFHMT